MILRIAVDAELEEQPYIDGEGLKKIQEVMASSFKAVALPLIGTFPEESVVVSMHHHYSTSTSNCNDCIVMAQDERN